MFWGVYSLLHWGWKYVRNQLQMFICIKILYISSLFICCCCSLAQLCLTFCDPMDCRMPGFPSLSPGVCLNSCPLNQWCHPTVSSSVISFSSCLQSFLVSGSFLISWLFALAGQSIGASASASVLPMNIQGRFSWGLTGLICLLSKELLRVFSSTRIQKHWFFSIQPSLRSNSHICTWQLKKP